MHSVGFLAKESQKSNRYAGVTFLGYRAMELRHMEEIQSDRSEVEMQ